MSSRWSVHPRFVVNNLNNCKTYLAYQLVLKLVPAPQNNILPPPLDILVLAGILVIKKIELYFRRIL